jgi:hypothetical protein
LGKCGNDLWKTFNRAQENVIAGGLSGLKRDENGRRVRRVSTREIKGINGNVNLNRALWTLAEKMAALKGAGPKGIEEPPIIDAEIVEAA